jgi:hypothetical protein
MLCWYRIVTVYYHIRVHISTQHSHKCVGTTLLHCVAKFKSEHNIQINVLPHTYLNTTFTLLGWYHTITSSYYIHISTQHIQNCVGTTFLHCVTTFKSQCNIHINMLPRTYLNPTFTNLFWYYFITMCYKIQVSMQHSHKCVTTYVSQPNNNKIVLVPLYYNVTTFKSQIQHSHNCFGTT